MRSFRYIPLFPLIWAVYCAFNIITNYDYYMRSEDGRLLFYLFVVMMVLCVGLALYLLAPGFVPRLMQKVSPGRHCPQCCSRIKKGTNFCAKCGIVVGDSSGCTVMLKCGRCGATINDTEQEFCPHCGNELRK